MTQDETIVAYEKLVDRLFALIGRQGELIDHQERLLQYYHPVDHTTDTPAETPPAKPTHLKVVQ